MRGNVYRHRRRRIGSIVLATGAALAFALGGASNAAAKAHLGRRYHGHAKVEIRSTVLARAAGHKIA
jgi:hypothetical protein